MSKQSFTHEFKLLKEPKDVGYICLNGAIAIQGTISGPRSVLGSGVKTDKEVEIALEHKISESITSKVGIKGDQKDFEALVDSVRNGSVKQFTATLGKMLGLEAIFQGAQLHENISAEVGLQTDRTPIVFKFSGFLTEDYTIRGKKVKLEGKVEGNFSVGPSKKAWAEIVKRLGSETVKRFLQSAGSQLARVAAWLISAGVLKVLAILVVAIAGTFGLTALTASLVRNARVGGTMQGLATWYISAYTAKVFDQPRPSGSVFIATRNVPNAEQIKRNMILAGEKDALADAKTWAKKDGIDVTNAANYDNIFRSYRIGLRAAAHGNNERAIWLLEQELKKAVKRKFRIRLPGVH